MDIEAIALFVLSCAVLYYTRNGSLAGLANLYWSNWVHSFKETRKIIIFVVQYVSVENV